MFGIMDEVNSDAFNLLGNSSGDGDDDGLSPQMKEAYEMFLGELVFSPNDPRMDIAENAEKSMDEGFLAYLSSKVATSTDVEEKMALGDLYEMILDIQEKLELRKKTEDREEQERVDAEVARLARLEREADEGASLTDADVLRKVSNMDTAAVRKEMGLDVTEDGVIDTEPVKKQTFYQSELSPEIRSSYEKQLKKLLPPYKKSQDVTSVVAKNYDKVDAQLVKILNERASNGDADSQAVLDAVAIEQQDRIAGATEKLKMVLSMGDPMRMEGKIVKLAKDEQIDEAFLLLLEANADQAKAAGATGPAELMYRLKERALQEKDKQSTSKEIKLLRQLLRESDKNKREALLEDAFTPRESFLVPATAENINRAAEGEQPEEEKPMPDVSPPDFINACKAVLINFGNVGDGEFDLTDKVKEIAADAEVVATRIYGQGMSNTEQQDRMWKDCTTSIFDLETMEIEAERMGDKAPWTTDGDDILPGFDTDGRMKIGG